MLGAWGLRGKHTSEKQSIHGRGGGLALRKSAALLPHHMVAGTRRLWGKMGVFAFQMHLRLRCRARALWGGAGRDTGEHYITHDTYLDGILFLLSF